MIKPLTSLRFFFAFFVFLSHLQGIKTDNILFQWLTRNIFFEGYLGVSFFFILSGFVISYSNAKKINSSKFTSFQFYKARMFRIYPLYILTTILGAVTVIHTPSLSTWLINIFAIQSFLPTINEHVMNAPSWSISNEFFFYLCFPLLYPLIEKNKKSSIIIIISSCIILFSTPLFFSEVNQKFIFYIHPLSRLLDFSLGILLFHLYQLIQKRALKRINFATWESLALLFFILTFLPHHAIPRMFRFSVYYWVPMSAIILVFALQRGHFSKLLQNRILVYLGEISFSFYLMHLIVINTLLPLLPINNPFTSLIIILIAVVFFSIILFEYFEKPVNTLLKRKFLHS
ncbi:acyltransferase family protein [Epilithonimonas vandammei]|uniref:acyltransferase family protein n=1 Tax=Epilithonimonas vandammei TaxID=2487072 RepID=UPI0028B26530|nr:acyltransferase [Epilithonimonas vandammei]